MSLETSNPFELLVQSVVDYAIYMLDPTGRVVSWNPGAERIKGYSADEIIGQHFSRFYTEEDRASDVPAHALATAEKKGRYEAEAYRLRKDGTRFWANVVIDAIRAPDGKLLGFAKITRDMTEKRHAQLALLEAERRFRMLVQGVTDYAIFMLDTDGKVTNWNAGAERIKQYRPDEIIGQHFSRFYTPEDVERGVPATALETARRTGRYEAEGWRLRKSGERFWASVVIDAIHDDDGELMGFAKVTRDMTEKREAQLRLEQSREQLFRSQKMEALGQLTGGLAHDFNNLLTAVLGATELALRQADDPDRVKQLLERIRTSAQRGASLTRQLLAFARAQPLTIKTLDVRRFMGEATELIRPALRSNIELTTECSDQLWSVEGDEAALELAILNLAFNARDAMKDGGQLKISARNVVLTGSPDGLSGEYVVLSVGDTGTGIAADVLDRVFEPFFTTKAYGEGTGLGLSQVFGFARQLGGSATVRSIVGEGSEFSLYLPASRSAKRDEDRSKTGEPHGSGKVLVVEDDETVAELAADLLREMGYEPVTVNSARQALDELAGSERPRLVFSDIIMPGGISGLELARKVRQRFPELPILLTTGYSEQIGSTAEFPVLPKPYEFAALSAAIAELVRD